MVIVFQKAMRVIENKYRHVPIIETTYISLHFRVKTGAFDKNKRLFINPCNLCTVFTVYSTMAKIQYTDNELIDGCLTGKRLFQLALYEKYSARMFAICKRYAKSNDEAEDVLQDGFVKVFTKMSQFSRESALEAWLKRIFINTAITNYRNNIKHYYQEDVTEINESEMETYEIGDSEFTKEELKSVIDGLPKGYNLVFSLYAIDGYKHKDIAEMLGIDIETSKSQYHRAKKAIQKKLYELSKVKLYE
jgi:RNA polymerase sigma-70 factor (ECF subfamily)